MTLYWRSVMFIVFCMFLLWLDSAIPNEILVITVISVHFNYCKFHQRDIARTLLLANIKNGCVCTYILTMSVAKDKNPIIKRTNYLRTISLDGSILALSICKVITQYLKGWWNCIPSGHRFTSPNILGVIHWHLSLTMTGLHVLIDLQLAKTGPLLSNMHINQYILGSSPDIYLC